MDIDKIIRDLGEVGSIKDSNSRLSRCREILSQVQDAEIECAKDFSIPYDSVKRLRQVIPLVQDAVSRLEAGKRRRLKLG